jgi:hypothetical protein
MKVNLDLVTKLIILELVCVGRPRLSMKLGPIMNRDVLWRILVKMNLLVF